MAVAAVKTKAYDHDVYTASLTIDDVAVDLTGATVLFCLKLCSSPFTEYTLAASIVSAVAGTVSYTVVTGFPTVPGKYNQEWQVAFSDRTLITFPSDGYNTVTILDDLN